MNLIKITAIFCIYNHRKYIEAALHSLLHQTSPVDRIICFDDGSKDGSREFILEAIGSDPRVSFARDMGVNKGLLARLNEALDSVEDGYVMHLSGDDVWSIDAVKTHRKLLQEKPSDWSIGAVQVVDEDMSPLRLCNPVEILERFDNQVYRAVLCAAPLFMHGWCYSIALYRRVGGLENIIPEDYPLSIKFAKACKPVCTSKVVSYYRKAPRSITNSDQAFNVSYTLAWTTLREAPFAPWIALRAASDRFFESSLYGLKQGQLVGAVKSAVIAAVCWPSPWQYGARLRRGVRKAVSYFMA